jgi:DNA-binding NtrC family response regulator
MAAQFKSAAQRMTPGLSRVLVHALQTELRAGRVDGLTRQLARTRKMLDEDLPSITRAELLLGAASGLHALGQIKEADSYLRQFFGILVHIPAEVLGAAQRLHVRVHLDQGNLEAAHEALLEIDRDVIVLSTDQVEVEYAGRTVRQRRDSLPRIEGNEANITAATHLLAVEVYLAKRNIESASLHARAAAIKATPDTDEHRSCLLIQTILRCIEGDPGAHADLQSLGTRWQGDDQIPVQLTSRLAAFASTGPAQLAPLPGINRHEARRWSEFSRLKPADVISEGSDPDTARPTASPEPSLDSQKSSLSSGPELTTARVPLPPAAPMAGPLTPNPDPFEDLFSDLTGVAPNPNPACIVTEAPLGTHDSAQTTQLRDAPTPPTTDDPRLPYQSDIEALFSSQGFILAGVLEPASHPRQEALRVLDLRAFSISTIIDCVEKDRLTGELNLQWTQDALKEAAEQNIITSEETLSPLAGTIYFRDGLIIDAVLDGADTDTHGATELRKALSLMVRLALGSGLGISATAHRYDESDRPVLIRVDNNAALLFDIVRLADEEAAGIATDDAGTALLSLSTAESTSQPITHDQIHPRVLLSLCSATNADELCTALATACRANRTELYCRDSLVAAVGELSDDSPVELQFDPFMLKVVTPGVGGSAYVESMLNVAAARYLSMPPEIGPPSWSTSVQDPQIVYKSEQMYKIIVRVRKWAEGDGLTKPLVPVLITGDPGVGKQLIAEMLHRYSGRANRRLITINMATLRSELAIAELFGAKKGSYTGCTSDRVGCVEAAEGGTVFLDEIAEMSLQDQAMLLRVMQFGTYRPLGMSDERRANVRFVLATNKDIFDETVFRADLKGRCLHIHVPSLAQRRADIRPLAQSFAATSGVRLSEAALAWLELQDWPGNVRQLQHLLHAAAYDTDTDRQVDIATLEELYDSLTNGGTAAQVAGSECNDLILLPGETFLQAEARFVARVFKTALAEADGNVTHAAQRLAMTPQGLRKKARALGIQLRETTP